MLCRYHTSIEDYLKNPPQGAPEKGSPEYEDSFAQQVDKALEKLKEMDTQLNDYVTEKTPSTYQAFDWYRRESRDYKAARATLEKAMEYLDNCFEYIESDKDDRFRTLYASTANMLGIMENIERGNLQVPPPGTKTENGKRVHFVNTVGRPHQPMATFLALNDKGKLELFQPADYKVSDEHYYDRSNAPLFAHDPCPEDLCQGALGNCYMLSMLSSIAAQDPQFIKDAMVDNGKDVTVRFFNKSHEPVYVTVDKTVPGLIKDTGKKDQKDQIFSKGPLWVQMMEKAFAASGIRNGKVEDAERGNYLGDYRDIENGYAIDFVSAFMGSSCSTPDNTNNIMIPSPNNRAALTREENEFIKIDTSTLDRARRKEVSDMRAMYGDIVNIIEDTLRQSDAFYLIHNSGSFEGMKRHSLNIKKLFNSGYPDPNGVKHEFDELFSAAGAYLEYRNKNARDNKAECLDRAVNRYQMAELITSLKTLYMNNPDMKKADLKELTECFGKLGENPSHAKQAAVQVHQQRQAAAAEKQRKLAEAQAKKQKTSAPIKKTDSPVKTAPKTKSV